MKKILSIATAAIKTCSMATAALLLIVTTVAGSTPALAEEKPIQHLKVADITTYEEAKRVFLATTAQLQTKTKLDAAELQAIHMITYSLEKSLAYFVEHSEGAQQASAKSLAEIVESVHINSENNRKEETQTHLSTYLQQAQAFAAGLP
ncbi:DUF6746 family protein [Biformimicrobium ophioploci]|nr:DUF6746 family protein [Microbulbifer sp. NKW57]